MRILIVDNSAIDRELVAHFVESHFSAKYQMAESGKEAIRHLSAKPKFDLVICDYAMHEGTGLDVFYYINETQPEVPFLLFTAESPYSLRDLPTTEKMKIVQKKDIGRLQNEIVKLMAHRL